MNDLKTHAIIEFEEIHLACAKLVDRKRQWHSGATISTSTNQNGGFETSPNSEIEW